MAPEPKRKPRENQYLFDLGVRGRKTGLTLPDTGIRDENGMEPMDHLFSSPEKAPKSRSTKKMNGSRKNANATLSSEDMDVGESTIPEPTAVLTERKRASMRLPPPRSKSPIKTYLQSPARRNPSLGPVSSPIRGSIVEPRAASVSTHVRRKLDFSNGSVDVSEDSVVTNSSPQKRGASANPRLGVAQLADAARLSPFKSPSSSEDAGNDEEDTTNQLQDDDTGIENVEESYQLINGGDEEVISDEEPAEQPEPEPQPAKKGRGRPKAAEFKSAAVEPVKKKNRSGRPKKPDGPVEQEQEPDERPAKRARRSLEAPKPANAKANRPNKTAPATIPPKSKGAGRKTKLTTISETDSPQIQRGPPMPRRPGLITLRRETPMDGSGFKQTRSGRNSIKPVAWWKNERIEYSDDENEDNWGKFLTFGIKGVVRADEVVEPKRAKGRSKPSKSKKRAVQPTEEDEEEAEPWEAEPGRIYGDILTWDPEDPTGAQAEEVEEEIALSSAAIITRDIAGATFRFAKTLTLPFFGSGMVDLPPGAIKKPKNSRKMQMAFFVFYGRVNVTVNDNNFRIGKGGMWQVPRGNTYSIENDYDKPARIFFSQGCEVLEEAVESQ